MSKARNGKVFLADRAIDDLREIESYSVEKWGKVKASQYLDAFDRFFTLVEAEPGVLRTAPLIDDLLTHVVEKHVVVCIRWNRDILVLTIVHASRDIITHLDILLPTLKNEVALLKQRLH